MKVSRKVPIILMMVVALFFIGTNVQSGWLFVIIAFLFALLVYSFLAPLVTLRGLSFEREIAPEVFEGGKTPIKLKVSNRSKRTRYLFEVSDELFSSSQSGKRAKYAVAGVKPGGQVAVKYHLIASKRGIYTGDKITVGSGAPFGLVYYKKKVFVPSPVLVYPSYFEIATFPIMEAGSYPVELFHELKSKGFGQEYYGTREYRPGDSLRFIHWRSTAKRGELIVREFEQEMAAPVSFIFDLEAGHNLGEGAENTLEYTVKIAASLSRYALKAGHPINLIASRADTEVEVVRSPDWRQTLEWLAKLEAKGEKTLSEVIDSSLHHLPGRSTAVVFLPSGFPVPFGSLRALQTKRVRIIAVLINSLTPGLKEGKEGAAGREQFYRLADELAASRVIVYPVNKGDDLRQCFSRLSVPFAG